jgi:uncharacterized integral membrane protein
MLTLDGYASVLELAAGLNLGMAGLLGIIDATGDRAVGAAERVKREAQSYQARLKHTCPEKAQSAQSVIDEATTIIGRNDETQQTHVTNRRLIYLTLAVGLLCVMLLISASRNAPETELSLTHQFITQWLPPILVLFPVAVLVAGALGAFSLFDGRFRNARTLEDRWISVLNAP